MEALQAATKTRRILSILVVDDNEMVREATAWMLADAGCEVHGAMDGVAALDFLTLNGPLDLMITDIKMPRMGGVELVELTRARWPSLPILLVSGRAQPTGTQPFISKPFDWEALVRKIECLVGVEAGMTSSGLGFRQTATMRTAKRMVPDPP